MRNPFKRPKTELTWRLTTIGWTGEYGYTVPSYVYAIKDGMSARYELSHIAGVPVKPATRPVLYP